VAATPMHTITIQLTNGWTGRSSGADLRVPADKPSVLLAKVEALLRETAKPLRRRLKRTTS
jgi:hypothetical protein